MAIPAVVDSLLREHNIQYDVAATPPHEVPAGAAQTALLQDGEQQLHVVYPAGTLLDLNALNQLTGCQLRAMPAAAVAGLCERRKLQHLSAVPGAMGLPTLVDKKLLGAPTIILNSGDEADFVYLRPEQFQQSLEDARLGHFSVDVASLRYGKMDEIEDLDDITHAVADFTQLRIKQRLEETLEIPPLPETAQRILKLRVDPYADVRDLATLVEIDPPLAAQVVSWATSPYYAYTGKIKSVHDAIVRVLGFDVVLNLALGMVLGKSLSAPKDSPRGFTPYWQQSVFCATAIEALVGTMPANQRPTIGIAYLSGLLHNFGHLVMAEVFPPHFSSYCRYQEANPNIGYGVIERFLLGVTRDQLSGWLMRLWSMPEEVCIGLRFQNEADYVGPAHQYANLIFVATRLLRLHGIGNAPPEPVPEELYERLQLDPGKAAQAIQHVVDASHDIIGRM